MVTDENLRDADVRPRSEDSNSKDQERERCVKRDGSMSHHSVQRFHSVSVSRNDEHDIESNDQSDDVRRFLKRRSDCHHNEGRAEKQKVYCSVRRHATGKGCMQRALVGEKNLVDAEVEAPDVFDQCQRTNDDDERGTGASDYHPVLVLPSVEKPQRKSGKDESNRRVGLHRYPSRGEAFYQFIFSHPSEKHEKAYRNRDETGKTLYDQRMRG